MAAATAKRAERRPSRFPPECRCQFLEYLRAGMVTTKAVAKVCITTAAVISFRRGFGYAVEQCVQQNQCLAHAGGNAVQARTPPGIDEDDTRLLSRRVPNGEPELLLLLQDAVALSGHVT
ncbi:hypothetical protein [Streptomyces sp. NPDC001389]|uniref:hypothetical protein n=1 Tax=Streptomyces sp. NPDC001389 TaxID=3364569 RepID=UPI0036C957E1